LAQRFVALGLLESREFGAKFGQGIAMKDELRSNAVEGFVSQQDLQEFFRPTRLDGEFRQTSFTEGTAKPAAANAASIWSLAFASPAERDLRTGALD